MDALILLGSFIALILIGMPVAYALGLSALIGAWWIDIPFQALMIQVAGGVNKFSLMAIPFFVLAGAIMAEGGMSRRLVAFAGVLVGFVRGGLSLVNIMASTFFGAISGSSVADTASVGSVLIPEMERRGYPREFATAVTISGSVQALLTPPSHNSVLYSLAAGGTVSIASLFMAGVVPGLLMSACLMVLCLIFAKKRNYPKGEVIPLKQALKICADALWGLMAMVIILGGILSGIFTATDPDCGVADPAGGIQPVGGDDAVGVCRQLRVYPADQRAAEHGVFGDWDVYGTAVCQGGDFGHVDRLPADAGVCGDLLELARLDLIGRVVSNTKEIQCGRGQAPPTF